MQKAAANRSGFFYIWIFNLKNLKSNVTLSEVEGSKKKK